MKLWPWTQQESSSETFEVVADLGGAKGAMAPPGPDQQPKFLLEITVLGTIFEKFSASLRSASNYFCSIISIGQKA